MSELDLEQRRLRGVERIQDLADDGIHLPPYNRLNVEEVERVVKILEQRQANREKQESIRAQLEDMVPKCLEQFNGGDDFRKYEMEKRQRTGVDFYSQLSRDIVENDNSTQKRTGTNVVFLPVFNHVLEYIAQKRMQQLRNFFNGGTRVLL